MKASITQQYKKDLSVSYGFLVDVWAAQKSKNGSASLGLNQNKRSTRYKK